MTKADGPGVMDKHIEKVVLFLCLGLLIYALCQYGISSRRTYEIAGRQDVTPKQIDKVLLDNAKELDRLVEGQDAPQIDSRNDLALLETVQANPLPAPQPADRQADGVRGVKKLTLPFGPPSKLQLTVVDIDGAGQAPPLAKLVEKMPPPARPFSWSGTEVTVREIPGPDGEPELKLKDLPTWRAVSWYPWRELYNVWQELLRSTVIEPKLVALGYEVDIETKQPDGSWKTTDDVKLVMLPRYDEKTGQIVQPAPLPEYTGQNGEALWEWLQMFGEEWSEYQLQPVYHPVWIRDDDDPSWEAHFPFDVLKIYPSEEQDMTSRKTSKKRAGRSTRADLFKRYRTTRKRTAGRSRRDYPEMLPEDIPPPEEMMYPEDVRRRRSTYGRTSRTSRRFPAKTKASARKAKKEKEEEAPVEPRPEIPDFITQLDMGKVLLWFHTNSLQPGREYRCRFRMVFANPLLTYDKDVEEQNRQDAYVPSIKTQWSEWSDPVSVKRDVDFFLTGSFPRGNWVTVTVFTKWMDQPLMYSINKIKAGERIRDSRKVKVLNPITGELMKNENGQDPVIEFDTGAVAVQIDFNRHIQIGDFVRDDVELIYLDSEGNLKGRSLYTDRHSEKYNELEAEAKEAATVFEPERTRKSKKSKKTKKNRDKKRRFPEPEFGEPGRGPMDMDLPRRDDRFKSSSRRRKSSSRKKR